MMLFLLPGQNKTIRSCTAPYSPARHHLSCYLKWSLIKSLVNGAFGKYLLAHLNSVFLAVTRSEEIEICMVKHWRVDREEKYEIVEKWFLKDLEMIDGKEADTVSVMYYKIHRV